MATEYAESDRHHLDSYRDGELAVQGYTVDRVRSKRLHLLEVFVELHLELFSRFFVFFEGHDHLSAALTLRLGVVANGLHQLLVARNLCIVGVAPELVLFLLLRGVILLIFRIGVNSGHASFIDGPLSNHLDPLIVALDSLQGLDVGENLL